MEIAFLNLIFKNKKLNDYQTKSKIYVKDLKNIYLFLTTKIRLQKKKYI